MITCRKCDTSQIESHFYRDYRYKDKFRYRPTCKGCLYQEYTKKYKAHEIKKTCLECGETFFASKQYSANSKYCSKICFASNRATLDYNASYIKSIQSHVNGLLLSDLHIQPQGRFSWNVKYKQFAKFIANVLQDYLPTITPAKDRSIFECKTKTHPDIKNLHQKWYKKISGKIKKIVPCDLNINKDVLMSLYLGDGSLHSIRGWAAFHLLDFSWEENEFLCEKIKNLGLECRVKRANKKNQPIIYFSRPQAIDLLSFLGPCPISCYDYKFKMPSKEVYNAYQREARKKRKEKLKCYTKAN